MSYFNFIFIMFFLVSLGLFLRFLVLFLLLLLNRVDKRKVITGGLWGIIPVFCVIIISEVSKDYVAKDIIEKFSVIDDSRDVNIKIIIDGIECKGDIKLFIKGMSQMKDKVSYHQGIGRILLSEIYIGNKDAINLGFQLHVEKEDEYLVFFKDLTTTDDDNIGVINTTYISECLAEKTGEEKERTETGSETK